MESMEALDKARYSIYFVDVLMPCAIEGPVLVCKPTRANRQSDFQALPVLSEHAPLLPVMYS